jgi:hypothetical protein
MGRRADHGSLADRSARSRGAPAAPVLPAASPVRHCWVHGPDGRVPGLLLAWEHRAPGWHGRVVHPVRDGDGWIVVEEWLPSSLLEPVTVGAPGHRAGDAVV